MQFQKYEDLICSTIKRTTNVISATNSTHAVHCCSHAVHKSIQWQTIQHPMWTKAALEMKVIIQKT